MSNWRNVKDMIEKDLDRIFWEEPEEVTMSKKGFFPSGAGVGGQILGNLVFLIADTQAMGWKCAKPTVTSALRDPSIELEECKKMNENALLDEINKTLFAHKISMRGNALGDEFGTSLIARDAKLVEIDIKEEAEKLSQELEDLL